MGCPHTFLRTDARTHSCVHGGLINAIPGLDTIENFYNGDAPADAMYVPQAILKYWFQNREPKPTTEQLTKLFTEKVFDNIFRHIERSKLESLIDATWKEIDTIYKKAWGRLAYPEERVLVCLFSFGGASRKDRYNWWQMREIDKKYEDKWL